MEHEPTTTPGSGRRNVHAAARGDDQRSRERIRGAEHHERCHQHDETRAHIEPGTERDALVFCEYGDGNEEGARHEWWRGTVVNESDDQESECSSGDRGGRDSELSREFGHRLGIVCDIVSTAAVRRTFVRMRPLPREWFRLHPQ